MTAAGQAPGEKLPLSLQLWIDVESTDEPLEVSLAATADEEGRFAVAVPAVPLDIRLAPADAGPIYRFGVDPAEKKHLGTLRLVAGASVSGFLRERSTGAPVAGAAIALSLPDDTATAGLPLQEWRRQGRLRWEGVSGRTGFFQLRGVAPGRYRLIVTPASGAEDGEGESGGDEHALAPRQVEVQVPPDAEVRLADLELEPKRELLVAVTPPVDPQGRRWQLRVVRDIAPKVEEHSVGQEGTVAVEMVAGNHRLYLSTADDEPMAYRAVNLGEEPTVGSMTGGDAEPISGERIEIDLDLVQIVGRVTWGDQPLVAQLKLKSGNGIDARQLESDTEGRFSGWMRKPRYGYVSVEVSAPLAAVERRRLLISAEEGEDDVLELTVELPAAAIGGRVEDSTGEPVADAMVVAALVELSEPFQAGAPPADRPGERFRAESDRDGHFRLPALTPGRYLLTAEHPAAGRAQPTEVWVAEEAEQEATLVLEQAEEIAGQLVDAAGSPVPAARLNLILPGHPANLKATSLTDGSFRLSLPRDAPPRGVLQVEAATHFLWSGCVDLTMAADSPLIVRLPALPAGTIHLTLTEHMGGESLPRTGVLFTGAGGFLRLGELWGWTLTQTDRMTGQPEETGGDGTTSARRFSFSFPLLAPGRYHPVATIATDWQLAAQACTGLGSQGAMLPAGGEIELRLDTR